MQHNTKGTASTKVVKAGAWYIVGNYLLKGITFLSAPLFSRMLPTSVYGEVNVYWSYEGIIYVLVGLALHSSINSAKYTYGEKLNKFVSSIIALILINSCVWLAGVNLFYDGFKDFFGIGREIANILIVHCICSSLLQVYNVYIGLNYSVGAFMKVSAFNALFGILISIVLILYVFPNQKTLGRILGIAIPMFLIGIYIIIFFFKKAKPTINRDFWKFSLVYSLPIIPHGIAQVILSSFDQIMIRDMVGAAEAGIYAFAFTVYSIFKVTATSLENVWRPWVYERMNAAEYDSIKKQGTKYAFGMALFTVFVLLVSPEIIKVLGDRDYWGSIPCVVPVVVGGYFAFLYTLPSLVEYYYKKTKFIALGSVGAAIVNIVLNYIFIGKFGYIAAAYTTLVTYLLYFAFHYFLATRIHGRSVFDTKKLMLISVGLLLVSAVVLLLEKYWLVRWLLDIGIGLFALLWAEKQFGIMAILRAKIKGRK